MKEDWDFSNRKIFPGGVSGWDYNIALDLRKNRNQIVPVVPRIQNIGVKGGIHGDEAPELRKQIDNNVWAKTLNLVPGQYHE